MTTLHKTVLTVAVLLPLTSEAGGLYLSEMGTTDLGFAGAGSAARAETPSTLYTNPAGMTKLNGSQLSVAAQAIYGDASYKLDGSQLLQGSDPGNAIGWLPSGSLFYTHNINDDLTVGIGVYSDFGLAMDFGNSWAGKNLATEATLVSATLQPSIAYRLNDQWSIGGGITANYGYFKLAREKVLNDGTGEVSDGDWAYGARLGLMYEASESTRFGLIWASEVRYDFNVDGSVTLFEGGLLEHTLTVPMTAGVTAPQQVMMSLYHRIDNDWAVMGDLGWQQWSAFADATLETNATGTVTSKMSMKDTWHTALGLQHTLNETVKLDAGIAFDTSMYQDQSNTSFLLPNGEMWRFGVGLEYAMSKQSDLGVAAEYLRTENAYDNSKLISGGYDTPEMFFMAVNYRYKF